LYPSLGPPQSRRSSLPMLDAVDHGLDLLVGRRPTSPSRGLNRCSSHVLRVPIGSEPGTLAPSWRAPCVPDWVTGRRYPRDDAFDSSWRGQQWRRPGRPRRRAKAPCRSRAFT
jgi:hypothetical protein